ncbi:hypothetical protein CFOL_v3_29075, partial [Cephalotus follicularis]
RYQ